MPAHSSRATAPKEEETETEDLTSVPAKYRLTRRTRLTQSGAETLLAELTAPKPKVSDKLRALVRGIRR